MTRPMAECPKEAAIPSGGNSQGDNFPAEKCEFLECVQIEAIGKGDRDRIQVVVRRGQERAGKACRGAMLDIKTLVAVTLFAQVVAGALLLFSWTQNRGIASLGLWGIAFLMCATGMGLVIGRGHLPILLSIYVAGGLWIAAHGLMWAAARHFEGRQTSPILILAGAAIWLAASQVEPFWGPYNTHRTMLGSAIIGAYVLLTAWEVWRGRDRELVSRWPATVLLIVHASVFLARVPLADKLPHPAELRSPPEGFFPFGVFEMLFHTMCMAVLLVNMAKERAELRQRQVAQVDPLTGVANRRAFLEEGEKLLTIAHGQAAPAALIMFDLDRFKQINDEFGHPAGDAVLKRFCAVANAVLPAGSLFGRLGGEEFGCVIPDVALSSALQIAEQIRATFADTIDRLDVPQATVSVGVATTGDAIDLTGLLVAADRALYRAKERGRNRVEASRAPISLVASPPTAPRLVLTP